MIPLLRPDWPGLDGRVQALSTLRQGGVSSGPYGDARGQGGLNLGQHVGDDPAAVAENRRRLRALLPNDPAWLAQVHGITVADAADASDAPQADASIASEPGVVCAIMTADCMPVLFADTQGRVVGAAHAGWRGLAGGVLEATVAAMRARGAQGILAWMGPAIGPRQFEVGEEVRQAFVERDGQAAQAFAPRTGLPGKYLADLYLLARLRLQAAGVAGIYGGGRCTVEERESFYSYRRDGVTGRMASLIFIGS